MVPVCLDVIADQITPVSIIHSKWKKSPYCFLLESVEGGKRLGRYTFLSSEPEFIIEERHGQTIVKSSQNKIVNRYQKSGIEVLRDLLKNVKPCEFPGLPLFMGGAVGYCSYETVHGIEKLPRSNPDVLNWPESLFFVVRDFIVFDNTQQLVKLVTCTQIDKKKSIKAIYDQACRKLRRNLEGIRHPARSVAKKKNKGRVYSFTSNVDKAQFMEAVNKAKAYIANGDIIQVVLSRRNEKRTHASPLDIYRTLRMVSPYMYLLKIGDKSIVGSSPEPLVRLVNRMATTRPIAGTRRRGKDIEDDERLERELLSDPKEKAEHIMLVDLGRNDLGRVCKAGTVRVPTFMSIERYSHVMHIVSEVTGKMKPSADAFDLLKASFPAGTVSGAPKIRAMEIIDELETQQRGPYSGALGYISFSGNMDMAITIRTLLWDKGTVSVQTGAGIVADSNPKYEFMETENKAAGMIATVELAEKGDLFWEQA